MESLPSISLQKPISPCETCLRGEKVGSIFDGVSLSDLTTTAKAGCPACRLRHLGVLKVLGPSATEESQVKHIFQFQGPVTRVTTIRGHQFDANSKVFLYLQSGPKSLSCPFIGTGREVHHRRSSYAPLIREWIRECHENHAACPQNTDVLLPKRALFVGDTGSERIQLRDVSGQKGSYTALSHCWGGEVQARTTKQSLKSNQEGMNYCDLPLSFQHAVTVTRDLGLQYLWIDALCIIQDDKRDWETESGNMAAVYKNAYLVIGASMSPNSHGGFLEVEKGGYHDKGESIAVVDEGDIPVYARREHSRNNGGSGKHPVDREPLSKRAWTFQEQLLATTMIHFTSREMVWECQSRVFCDCMELDRQSSRPSFGLSLRRCLDYPFPERFRSWYHMVNTVMQRDITNPHDILPCLSGIARRFQHSGAGKYLAGLWYDDLPLGLLWRAPYASEARRAIPYRGPTWSWASIHQKRPPYDNSGGIADSGTKLRKTFANVIEAECFPSGEDPLGTVSGGFLTLSAPLLELTDMVGVLPQYDFDFIAKENLYCLFVGELTCGANGSPVCGLILQQQRHVSETTFERVGHFSLRSGEEHEMMQDAEDGIITIV